MKTFANIFITIFALTFVLSAPVYSNNPTLPKATYVNVEEVKKWEKEGKAFTFIDVRAPVEYEAGHLKDAINMEYNKIETHVKEFVKDKPYVFYCTYSAWRAPYAANVLADLGFKNSFILECYNLRLQFEKATDKELDNLKNTYIHNLENKFRLLTPKIVDYKTSKTDKNISTIRHGFNLLKRVKELEYIRKKVINEKAISNLDNDFFADDFDVFLTSIEPETIIEKIHTSFINLKPKEIYADEVNKIITALEIFDYSFDECVKGLNSFVVKVKFVSYFYNDFVYDNLIPFEICSF